jgi:hypothetical protein
MDSFAVNNADCLIFFCPWHDAVYGNKIEAIFGAYFNRLYTIFGRWLYYHLQVITVILRDILIGINSVTLGVTFIR